MRFFLITLALLLFAPVSFADISDAAIDNYNKALTEATRAEEISSAAQALASEALASPDDEMSTLLAFEAAWTLCQIGQCKEGLPAANFAAARTAKSADEYPSQETRTVLARYMAWKLDDSNENRKDLASALSTLKAGDVSQVTLAAHRGHYLYCTQKGAWRDAAKAAAAAAQHSAAIKSDIFDEYALAELTRITAEFQLNKTAQVYSDIVDLEDEVDTRLHEIRQANPKAENQTLTSIRYKTIALSGAINAYLSSTGNTQSIKRIHRNRPARAPVEQPDPNFCEGSIVKPPRPSYPQKALDDGIIGSLVIGFTIDQGKPKDIQVLAAIPQGVFEKEAIRAMEEIKWAPKEGIDTSTCSMVQEGFVYPMVFSISN